MRDVAPGELGDVEIDGRAYAITGLEDIKWLRTAQFLAGIKLSDNCNLDKREKALKNARTRAAQEARAAWENPRRPKKRGREYTESGFSA